MILLLPIGLLLVAALAIAILDRLRPKFGTSWLIASVASVIAWLVILVLRLRLPTTLEILSFEGGSFNLVGELSLLPDYDAWPYVLSLITINLSVILTDAARTRYDITPLTWAASLGITATGLLALQSGTSMMLMFTWVIVDLIELLYLLRLEDINRFIGRIVLSYGVRTASILMLFLAAIQGWQMNGSFPLTQIPQTAGFLFLIAAGLRLGVFPVNLPFLQEPNLRRGAGNIIRLAPAASSLVLLARLPENLITESLVGWAPVFQGMLAVTAVYAALRWIAVGDEIEGRPFWIIGWAALAAASVLNGAPRASLAWGLALLLPGSLLFLYYPRVQRINFLLFIGLIGLVGLPFTPAASGWSGLVANGVTFWTFLFILAHALMVLGYLERALQPGGEAGALESWARLVYPLGLILIIQAVVTLGLIGWPGSLTMGTWWLALISNLLVVAGVIVTQRLGIRSPYIKLPASSSLTKFMNWLLPRLEPIFRLEWLYQLLWQIYRVLGYLLKSFSKILESDGGILWTILLLVLMISLLAGFGGN
jgi:hypothetical protein